MESSKGRSIKGEIRVISQGVLICTPTVGLALVVPTEASS